jgi:hypothetical protein
MTKQYLGDSVYLSYDGFHFVLTTENGLPSDPSNTIFMEPQVIEALNQAVKRTIEELNQPKEEKGNGE